MYVDSDDEEGFDDHLLDDFDRNWISVGMKVGCAWTCGLVYLVYLLFPDNCGAMSRCCCCPCGGRRRRRDRGDRQTRRVVRASQDSGQSQRCHSPQEELHTARIEPRRVSKEYQMS